MSLLHELGLAIVGLLCENDVGFGPFKLGLTLVDNLAARRINSGAIRFRHQEGSLGARQARQQLRTFQFDGDLARLAVSPTSTLSFFTVRKRAARYSPGRLDLA